LREYITIFNFMADFDERVEELDTLEAIFPELKTDLDQFSATLDLAVTPSIPLLIRFVPDVTKSIYDTYVQAASNGRAYVEHDVPLAHLPPLSLQVTLPEGYPAAAPPEVHLSATKEWLPRDKLMELELEAAKLWEEYGRCQMLYTYIDYLQQASERGFDLDQRVDGCLVLPVSAENELVAFDAATQLAIFNAGHYDCGICLEPKKGSSCYKMRRCGHVFCLQCLQDFYNNAITEGDVAGIRCLDPTCGKEPQPTDARKRKRNSERTLHPRELLAMKIEEPIVRRYVELKRKKKLEADKSTVYCPRSWCQGPAKSTKYPPIPADLASYVADDSSSDEDDAEAVPSKHDSPRSAKSTSSSPPDPTDRLAVCEKCSLAFCRVCYMGWHGPFARCYPRDPNELSAEEKASYDYIRQNTSPCPTCSSPTQKTMGCNHMKCFQCNTHFCYLCGAWLDGGNPYQHFNKQGTECFQRLWELEEGDEGQRPEDGRGFAGGRGWEQMAIEVAREADEREAEAAAQAVAREAQEEDDLQAAQHIAAARDPPVEAMAQVRIDAGARQAQQDQPRAAQQRARRNPFPARPAQQGAAEAVRRHERAGNGRAGRRPPAAQDENGRQQAELQRFLAMAERDEEDGWDSDELDEDDGRFVIR
jgi:E3 ubiquitin-protein ligase RNF14